MGDGLRLALTTLTVLPVRGPVEVDRRSARTAMLLAPLVGLALGAVAAGVAKGVQLAGADLLAAVLAVAALAVLTRGLHLDGLVDTVDGLASYRPRAQALEIMRSPEAGPLGVAALVLVLLAQVAAVHACLDAGRGTAALLLAGAGARLAVTVACTTGIPAASPSGLGAAVAGTVPRAATVTVGTAVLVVGAALGLVDEGAHPALGPLAVLGGLAAAAVLLRHAVRRLGGVTGDVLGALVETTTTVVLVVVATA
ncbi:MAG TPA: adenosylcobinamide-GDP ribazoletransferase [Mycobacteriales bacterium]|nr:adenosylcobinamide-GDP ribazoletransferase [Mycobacteriales bacterium]